MPASSRPPTCGWSARLAARPAARLVRAPGCLDPVRARAGADPELLHYNDKLYLIAMERCRPHIIMRRGMVEIVYPVFARQIAEYLATTLYFTSDMALPAAEKSSSSPSSAATRSFARSPRT